MLREINYYFSVISPWAYMGHEWFMATARNRRVPVAYKPMKLMEIFSRTGGLPLAKRGKQRQDYRFVELQRWQMARGIEMNLKPKFFPFDASLADRVVIAADQEKKYNPGMFTLGLFRAAFCEERDLTQEAEIIRIAENMELDGQALLKLANSDEIEAIYQANTDEAEVKGVFGSPSYEIEGEVFWGQDRIELLDRAIEEGRSAYKAP